MGLEKNFGLEKVEKKFVVSENVGVIKRVRCLENCD